MSKYPDWCSKCVHNEDDPFYCGRCLFPNSSGKPTLLKVNNSYYDIGDISTIDVIRAKLTPEQYKGFIIGNIIKYALRMEHKGRPKEDCEKLYNYVEWLRDHYDS